MSFPQRASDFNAIVAVREADGSARFLDSFKPAAAEQEGVFEAAWFWEVTGGHTRTNAGAPAESVVTARPAGSTFGLVRFPAHSAGKLDVASTSPESASEAGHDGNAGMHATETIDYEIILSGKVDFVLPGNQRRTLVPGDVLIVAGVPHAWENRYDEDCIYASVTIGVTE